MHTPVKKILAFALTVVMLVSLLPVIAFAEEPAVALPTATVTPIEKDDLTFALSFSADAVTEEQMTAYGDWTADFVITLNKTVTFNADGTGDGYLAGQYDDFGPDWVLVPPKAVTVEANTPLQILDFAAKLFNQPDFRLTYANVVDMVKVFNCGVYFTPEFLQANPDLEVSLDLQMINPEDPTEAYTVGPTYEFTAELPTATVTPIEKEDLTFAMNFRADEATDLQLKTFGEWFADFELTINKDVTFHADGSADGYLAGQYNGWSPNWVYVPPKTVTMKANEPLRIMSYAAELMGEPGLKYTYKEVYEVVKNFNCGVYFTPEFLLANPDLEVTLELRMYDPSGNGEGYTIGQTYEFKMDYVAHNTTTNKLYRDAGEAALEAEVGETVVLLADTETKNLLVAEGSVFDLNGYTLNASYVSSYGDLVDNSQSNEGTLNVPSKRFMIREDNSQLPVGNGEGYRFIEIVKFNTAMDGEDFVFQPVFEAAAHTLLAQGYETTGVTVQLQLSWTQDTGKRTQSFVYTEEQVQGFIASYVPTSGGYRKLFRLSLNTSIPMENFTYQAVVVSNTGVQIAS